MQVKHRFNVEIPDDPAADAAGQVLPSHWNQDHEFFVEPVSLVGNDGVFTSPAKAISVGPGLRLLEGELSLEPPPSFFKVLSGFSEVLTEEDHGLQKIRTVRISKDDGTIVSTEVRILGANISIFSNVPLDGLNLFLE